MCYCSSELLEKTNKIVIIDHHRRSTDYIDDATLTFQEVYASSAAELVTELLQYVEIPVSLKQIEILLHLAFLVLLVH